MSTLQSEMPTGSGIRYLDAVLSRHPGERISVGAIIDALGPNGWGLCLLAFGLPGLIPGVAPLLGVPLCIVAVGMIIGQAHPWLPVWMRQWQANRRSLRDGLQRLDPMLRWIEHRLDERRSALLGPVMLRAAGVAALTDAILIILPIPFGNTAPAIAVVVLALGLMAGDGLAMLVGIGLSVIALGADLALIWAGWQAISVLIAQLF